MNCVESSTIDRRRGKRRKTIRVSTMVPHLSAATSERNKLASVMERVGCSAEDLDTFLNGSRNTWVLRSRRFKQMVSAFGEHVSYNLFDLDHHIRCACSVLTVDPFKVVFGQKNQGKSQLLYFVFKLLQHCGAVVVYLDPSMVIGGRIDLEAVIEWWNIIGTRLNMPMEFQRFIDSPTLEHLLAGLWLLYDVVGKTMPVWVIVDGVTEFSTNHPLSVFLPYNEQDLRPVKWILAGNDEMGYWVDRTRMDMFVFDIPLFSPNEVKSLVHRLEQGGVTKSRIVNAIGITEESLVDWLMEKFAGVPGYIVEFTIAIKNDFPAATFADKLKRNIEEILMSLPLHQVEYLARNLPLGNWGMLQNLGFCGYLSPNARILQYIYDWVRQHAEHKHRGN